MLSAHKQFWRNDLPASVDICIPFYKDDPTALIAQLSQQMTADACRLSLCDDGSADAGLTDRVRAALERYPGPAALYTLAQNSGRAQARNMMLRHARADWVLALDADMALDREDFILTYRQAAERIGAVCCIVGGFRVALSDATPTTRLHAAQSLRSECKSAAQRARHPGRYVYSSSVFVHRKVLERHLFDPQFSAWGWEDVEWGLRISREFDIHHIDNPARHRGLDPDRVLLQKYAASVANFRRIKELHPDRVARMPIARMARVLAHLPFQDALRRVFRGVALTRSLPVWLRVYGLKLYRAAEYAAVYRG